MEWRRHPSIILKTRLATLKPADLSFNPESDVEEMGTRMRK